MIAFLSWYQSSNSYCYSFPLIFKLWILVIMTEKSDATKDSKNAAFTLHPSDNPGTILVSFPLNGENYTMWSRAMIKALSAENKSGFINGVIKKPSTSDSNFELWKQCDDMVASWIVNAITPELARDTIYAETAHDLWVDLQERFSQINGPRIFELQKRISFISQGLDSITAYYSKLKGL